jgi:hypothetical protein
MALLAGAVSHTPEGEEVLRGARMRMARKPSATARELLRNFPKGGKRRRKRKKGKDGERPAAGENGAKPAKQRSRRARKNAGGNGAKPDSEPEVDLAGAEDDPVPSGSDDD